jgi:dihydropteroate synthase type 2
LANVAELVGIVNITEDSFSDGGRFLDERAAIGQGERLLSQGAHWLDLGAESSNPEGRPVPAEQELSRLLPVLRHFKRQGARVSVDTHKPEVIRAVLAEGADMINDITALSDAASVQALAGHSAQVVLMFSRAGGARADRTIRPPGVIPEILTFFQQRLADLGGQGIARARVILDPGMGFFLGSNAEPSLWVLKQLGLLGALGCPIYVSVSRKSFIGTITGKPPADRGAGTLAAELWALQAGASYVRTHEPGPLADAWAVWQAIRNIGEEGAADSATSPVPSPRNDIGEEGAADSATSPVPSPRKR